MNEDKIKCLNEFKEFLYRNQIYHMYVAESYQQHGKLKAVELNPLRYIAGAFSWGMSETLSADEWGNFSTRWKNIVDNKYSHVY